MKPPPPLNEDFLRTPVEYDAPKQKSGHLFLWTVFLLLLVGFSMACWRFKVQDPPKGGFEPPEKIYEKFNALSPAALRKLNAELERSYLRNYAAANEKVPYVTGRFTILDSFELGPNDFVTSGVVTLAVASDYPKLLIEHLYCAPPKVAPIIKRNLQTGMDIDLRRTYELTAVLHVTKPGDGHIILTVVPLNYGSYVLKGPDGGFSLEPPTELNVAAGWPLVRGERYLQADQAYVNFRTHTGFGPLAGYREAEKRPDSVLKGVDPTPEPAPTVAPAPTPVVAQASPPPAKPTPPTGKKPVGSPTPIQVAKNDTPAPRAVAVTPTPANVVKATDAGGVSLQPFLQAPSAGTPSTAGAPTPAAAVADNTKNWRTYSPGQQPGGKQLRAGELTAFNERGGLNGATVYLGGQFTVRAVGENKSRGIKNAVLRTNAESNVRIIVEYPSDRPLPAQGTEITRDEQRPFLITHIQATPDGTLNVYAREIME